MIESINEGTNQNMNECKHVSMDECKLECMIGCGKWEKDWINEWVKY